MAIKKPRPRKPKSIKLASTPELKSTVPGIDIHGDPETLKFNIHQDGEFLGSIEDEDFILHRMILESQSNAFNDGMKQSGDYVPYFSELLTQKYGIKVNDVNAYKIAEITCRVFASEKKSTLG